MLDKALSSTQDFTNTTEGSGPDGHLQEILSLLISYSLITHD